MSNQPSTSKFDCFEADEESEEGEINDDDDDDEIQEIEPKTVAPDVISNEPPKKVAKLSTNDSGDDLHRHSVKHHKHHHRGKKRKHSDELNNDESNDAALEKLSLENEPKIDDGSDDDIGNFTHKDVIKEITMEAMNNRVTITVVESVESCTHEVANPPSHPYVPLVSPQFPKAKTYPFILDPFQNEAILCIDNNQSVLVSAHTSAGKTVVAEYAVASALRDKQRVIYTTPIKALSNQKYREFNEEFKDVGLITGDVTINQNASCLIMTTEILRNMLYRGSEITREVGWVIFDEIHYMRDKERGVVWEETIILLPRNVHFVFLSATIPNARQFCEWICSLHEQPCHVVYTDYRPTPLQHFIFPSGGDGIHLVVDEKGRFRDDNFNAAMAVLANAGDNAKGDSQRGRKGGMKNANSNVFQVVKMIMERNFQPVIVFSFSKKDCELYAMQLSKLDFNTTEEKKLVDEVFANAIEVLKPEDKKIPQVENVLPFLRRGIGIHHGGLLPILKETIEIMFGEGLIKALFATETFAMGLNMPARTVVFTGMRKFDGKEYRWLSSGEYIQMSGRAGRRGLDDKGIVILMIDEKVTPTVGKNIVKGQPDPINSAFQLTYNMVLNLLRVEEINPEYMMERSFFQFQNQSNMPDLFEKYEEIKKKCNSIRVPRYEEMKVYHELRKSIEKLKNKCRKFTFSPMNLLPFLKSGRMIKAKHDGHEFDWGIVVNFNKTTEPFKKRGGGAGGGGNGPRTDKSPNINLTVDILMHLEESDKIIDGKYVHLPCPPGKTGIMEVLPVPARNLLEISSVRVHIPEDLRPLDARLGVIKLLEQVKQRFKDGGIPLLDPIQDMKINDSKFLKFNEDLRKFEERLDFLPISKDPEIKEMYATMQNKIETRKAMRVVREELSCASSILQMEELKNRKKVLRRLGFCDENDVIQLKGRVACEVSGADELLLTEMIFNGTFDNISPPLAASLLSCFVCDEKSTKSPVRADELADALRNMQHIARKIAHISRECSIDLDEDKYVEKFKPSLMDVVFSWCNGAQFLDICKMTDIFEGSIIRCIRRLEELLRQLCQAAKGIGNVELEAKFSEAIRLIKRDIVFAASLYL